MRIASDRQNSAQRPHPVHLSGSNRGTEGSDPKVPESYRAAEGQTLTQPRQPSHDVPKAMGNEKASLTPCAVSGERAARAASSIARRVGRYLSMYDMAFRSVDGGASTVVIPWTASLRNQPDAATEREAAFLLRFPQPRRQVLIHSPGVAAVAGACIELHDGFAACGKRHQMLRGQHAQAGKLPVGGGAAFPAPDHQRGEWVGGEPANQPVEIRLGLQSAGGADGGTGEAAGAPFLQHIQTLVQADGRPRAGGDAPFTSAPGIAHPRATRGIDPERPDRAVPFFRDAYGTHGHH